MLAAYESYQPASNNNRKPSLTNVKHANKRKGGKRVAILVLLICSLWAIWQAQHQTRVAPARQMLLDDLGSLWDISDADIIGGSGGAAWTIRWNLTARDGTMASLEHVLFTDAAGNPSGTTADQNGRSVMGVLPKYGGKVTLSLIASTVEKEQIMLLYETQQASESGGMQLTKHELIRAADAVSSEVEVFTDEYESSMNVKGFTGNSDALDRISRLAAAKQVDSYVDVDGGTVSDTFFTAKLKNEVIVDNGHRANLQIALHRSTEEQNLELVVGVPVITGDYSIGNE
ncbi:YwmB family TATA-box binding protein [Paenibacillus sp. YIM B09110]|uniref:YwmB family TATA-box binding protein n=1 Tax=Paenibacillus sp. YIM B09110 TaxID=3126102 RepID=UPI00301DA4EF